MTTAGVSRPLEEPFFVMATQNPIEMEGTYPLPEAQLDRFLFKLHVTYPGVEELKEIAERTTGTDVPTVRRVADADTVLRMQALARAVPVAGYVQEYAARVVLATHPDSPFAPDVVRRYVRYGASPRGVQALIRAGKVRALASGRLNVALEDIRSLVLPALRHRLLLTFEGEASGTGPDEILHAAMGAAEAGPLPRGA